MTLKRHHFSLYLVTDRELSKERPLIEIIKAAVKGGVTSVQLREKSCSTRTFIEQGLAIRDYCKQKNIPLIINDRIDVAMAIEADGVHLGQDDMPIERARKIVGGTMLIGLSTHSVEEAVLAEKCGADYIGAGPVYSTVTKQDTSPIIGTKGVFEIRKAVGIPIVGIGGIHENNASEVIKSGADGVAVVSAIIASDNPCRAASDLTTAIQKGRRL